MRSLFWDLNWKFSRCLKKRLRELYLTIYLILSLRACMGVRRHESDYVPTRWNRALELCGSFYSKESVSKQISIAFLERVKADFKKRNGGGRADTTVAKSLNKKFGRLLAGSIVCSSHSLWFVGSIMHK
ncbi:uncharacterized protein LOC130960531 [Arachis stenosperma]|uniref:uncharacterized protein LOC130960531 n=1 Tax=Arachis stenosperma TaxID=217475 RepID=UPI0025ACD433|nr:uncharacterized protein LOC130960531 [Arachis stenosperma]